MDEKRGLTKIAVSAGTVLAWIPIRAPVVFSVQRLMTRPFFRFDYLLPAELFPVALLGGLLLLWAAIRMRSRARLIGGGLAVATLLWVGGQALAVVTGLASGRTQLGSGWGALAAAWIGVYCLALPVTATGGALLLRDTFGRSRLPPAVP